MCLFHTKSLYKRTLLFRQGHVAVLKVSECLFSCPHCLWFEFSFLLLLGVVFPVWDLHCSLVYSHLNEDECKCDNQEHTADNQDDWNVWCQIGIKWSHTQQYSEDTGKTCYQCEVNK